MAAKGRIAPSENAGNADLVNAPPAGFFGPEKDPDLKADPWSVFFGTNARSKIELPLFSRRPDEGAGRRAELRKVDFKSVICIDQSLYHIPPIHINSLRSDFEPAAKQI